VRLINFLTYLLTHTHTQTDTTENSTTFATWVVNIVW